MTTTTTQDVSMSLTQQQLAAMIDHTKLTFKPGEDEEASIRRLCAEAKRYGFYAVCVRPQHVMLAKDSLQGSEVKVATVIGFPQQKTTQADEAAHPQLGQVSLDEKLVETKAMLNDGVDELDLVMNVAQFRIQKEETLREFQAIQQAAQGRPVKVIIETDLLSDEEIRLATRLCHQASVAMVKTCTGMISDGRGATVPVVELIAQTLKGLGAPVLGIKASGGIRTAEQAQALIRVGATRIGASVGVELIQGF